MNNHLIWAEQLCSRREYCIYDLRVKLKGRGVGEEEAERVIAALIQNNFLNEERYVRAFVHDKSKLLGWGPEKIRFALHAKQLPDSLIRLALTSIDSHIQKERLRHLLEVKWRSLKAASPEEVRVRLIRFGLSRGFSYEEIRSEVARLQKEPNSTP